MGLVLLGVHIFLLLRYLFGRFSLIRLVVQSVPWSCTLVTGKEPIRLFTKKPLKNKGYSPQVITGAISSYNLGYACEEAAKSVIQRFKVNVSKSSIHSWVTEFADMCTYQKIRSQVVKLYEKDILMEYSFSHSGLTYTYMVHVPKLEILCHRHPSMIRYLEEMHTRCPSAVFEKGERCSQVRLDVYMKKQRFYNQACRLAGLALSACRKKTQRNSVVERFMVMNDSSTIACEVPVWFWEKNRNSGMCGHIDLVQMRHGCLYALDYKPVAAKENEMRVASQLYQYVLGLSFRIGIPLKTMRCAWFDENRYYEFRPLDAEVTLIRRHRLNTS